MIEKTSSLSQKRENSPAVDMNDMLFVEFITDSTIFNNWKNSESQECRTLRAAMCHATTASKL